MKKLTLFLALTALGLSVGVMAKPVKSFDQAIDLVMKSVEKNKLTSLKKECLMFVESEQTDVYYYVDVREVHNETCGGDPETAPYLFTYSVNKAKGFMKTSGIWREDGDSTDTFLYPIDPISPVIVYGEDGSKRKLKYYRKGSDTEIK